MSQRADKHLRILKTVLQRFKEHKLKLNAEKRESAVSEIRFLGYKIGKEGLSLDLKTLCMLDNYIPPLSKRY